MFFAVGTGCGLEIIFVEDGSTVWAHYEHADYRMIAGQDDKWVKMPPPNTKNRKQQVSGRDIDEELQQVSAQDMEEGMGEAKKKM